MIVSDRLLTVLQQYIKIQHPELELAKLRDTDAKQEPGVTQLILDADEPDEHDGMHGVFIIPAEIHLKLHAKDMTPSVRRGLLSGVMDTLGELDEVKEFTNDPLELRGICNYGFHLYDLVIQDGGWQVDGDELVGVLLVEATCMGMDRWD